MKQDANPKLSVIVVCFNMFREAQRTLYSLSSTYQRHVEPSDYQVIVIDNGSRVKVPEGFKINPSGTFFLKLISPAPFSVI
jgi:GT2 family glycosyltransferase